MCSVATEMLAFLVWSSWCRPRPSHPERTNAVPIPIDYSLCHPLSHSPAAHACMLSIPPPHCPPLSPPSPPRLSLAFPSCLRRRCAFARHAWVVAVLSCLPACLPACLLLLLRRCRVTDRCVMGLFSWNCWTHVFGSALCCYGDKKKENPKNPFHRTFEDPSLLHGKSFIEDRKSVV